MIKVELITEKYNGYYTRWRIFTDDGRLLYTKFINDTLTVKDGGPRGKLIFKHEFEKHHSGRMTTDELDEFFKKHLNIDIGDESGRK